MRNRRATYKLIFVAVFAVFVWQLASNMRLLPALYLPSPVSIVKAYRSQLGLGAIVTVWRALSGYLAGLALAYIAHASCLQAGLEKHLDTQFTGARAVPIIAVLPLFLIWF